MSYSTKTKKSGSKRYPRRKTILIGLAVVLAVVIAVLEISGATHIFRDSLSDAQVTTVPKATLPPTSKTSSEKTPTSPSSSQTQGTDTDNKGRVTTPATTDTKQWTTSKSGAITVKQPVAGGTFKSGGAISGSATVPQVKYRLIDNQTGILTEGVLSVVNGSFSGNLQFSPASSSGRLDVFSVDASGVESNTVEIGVGF